MSKGQRRSQHRPIRVYFSDQEYADVTHTAERMGISPGQWLRSVACRNTEWSIMRHVDEHFPDRAVPPEKPRAPEPKAPSPAPEPTRACDVHASPFGVAVPEGPRPPKPLAVALPYPIDRSPIENKPAPPAPLATEPKPLEAVREQAKKRALRAEVRGRADEPEVWLTNGRVFGGPHTGGFHQGDK